MQKKGGLGASASIDISGNHGPGGRDGGNGHHEGESGQSGGPSVEGGNGGVAYLRISRVLDQPSAIQVTGTVHNQPFNQLFDLGAINQLHIDARGGNGGRGGDGGDGACGRHGMSGMDATRYSSGTNGGPGGPGGNGGNATNGANGGTGGFVQIIVTEADMDLLEMLGPVLVDGGFGGRAGRNGEGGHGGSGGRGGSSHTYSTTRTEHYRDHNGHNQTRTHTDWHTNPGGFPGPDGPHGYPGNAQVFPGRDGNSGSFEFIIEHPQGPVKYLDKYNVKMTDFTISFPEEDAVIEPGEKGFVTTVTLFNAGKMPSPIHQDLFVSVLDTENIQGIGALQIPRALAPQQQIIIPFQLEYQIKYPSIPHTAPKPYEVIGQPQIQLFSPSINRYIPSAAGFVPRTFKINYPIEMSQFQCLRTFCPGQVARILFTMTNNSTLSVGGTARPAQIRMTASHGQFDVSQLAFNFDGREQKLTQPYIHDLPEIKAKETIVVEAQIKIPSDVGYLLKGQFMTHIFLTDPRNTEVEPNPCIHSCPYDIRTGFHYQPIPDQDVVFVISEKTTLEEVNFIQTTCATLGLKQNFYDISMHGALNLLKPLPHLQTFLAQDLRGKTLVILNNEFNITSQASSTVSSWALQFVEKRQLIRAVSEFDVHFAIFSPHPHNFISWGLQPSTEPLVFQTKDDFLKFEYELQEKSPMTEKIGTHCIIHIQKAAISFSSKNEQLMNQSEDIVKMIQTRFPYMNYVGVPYFKEVAGTKQIGELHLFRTIPQMRQNLTFYDFNAILTRHVDFLIGFLLSVDISKRSLALTRLINSPEHQNKKDLIFALQESIMFTLGREFQLGSVSKHSTKFHFDELSSFVETMRLALSENKQWTVENLEEFIHRIKIFADRQYKVKDMLLFWVAHAKLQKKLNKKITLLINFMTKETKEVGLQRQNLKKTINEEYRARKKNYPVEIPKYVKATKVNLDINTFRLLVGFKDMIPEKNLMEFFAAEAAHNKKMEELIELKRQLDAQLEV